MSDIQEAQVEVRSEFQSAFSNPIQKSEHMGSAPKGAFDSNEIFNTDNWNDYRISLFRRFFGNFFGAGAINNEIAFIGKLMIYHHWADDENYVFIRNYLTNDLYYVNWYKSRGRTDNFICNGKPIRLEEFRWLISEMMNGDVSEFE